MPAIAEVQPAVTVPTLIPPSTDKLPDVDIITSVPGMEPVCTLNAVETVFVLTTCKLAAGLTVPIPTLPP